MLLFNLDKAKDNLVGLGDYFFTKLWNYCGFGGGERAGGGARGAGGIGWRV
jgi:hypothetical protein